MELKRRTPEEREAYLLDQIVNLQSALAAANEECERLSEENKELNRQLAVAKKIFDSCRNNDNHWGDVEVENHRLKADLAAKDAMLAAATDVIRQCKDAIDSVTFHSIRGYATVYTIDSRKHYEARRASAGWLEPTKGAEHHG